MDEERITHQATIRNGMSKLVTSYCAGVAQMSFLDQFKLEELVSPLPKRRKVIEKIGTTNDVINSRLIVTTHNDTNKPNVQNDGNGSQVNNDAKQVEIPGMFISTALIKKQLEINKQRHMQIIFERLSDSMQQSVLDTRFENKLNTKLVPVSNDSVENPETKKQEEKKSTKDKSAIHPIHFVEQANGSQSEDTVTQKPQTSTSNSSDLVQKVLLQRISSLQGISKPMSLPDSRFSPQQEPSENKITIELTAPFADNFSRIRQIRPQLLQAACLHKLSRAKSIRKR